GVSIAYLYTCIAAYQLFDWHEKGNDTRYVAPFKKGITLIGIIASIIFIALLLVPASPAFLGKESFIALIIWCLLVFIFYMIKYKTLNMISNEELTYLILGKQLKK